MKKYLTLLFACGSLFLAANSFAQGSEHDEEQDSKLEGLNERTTTLEAAVAKINQLKISGYVQPQWTWTDIDSLGNQLNSRNGFGIRRGRIKFTHTTEIPYTKSSITAVVYPDITEAGLVIKEVYATWNAMIDPLRGEPELAFSMGSMNRPFGYEIGYSSSAREFAERSLAENRLFSGERDLGFQVMYKPDLGGTTPMIEMGIFNGSDNFGQGPVSALGSSNRLGFTSNPIGTIAQYTNLTGASDSAFKAQVNAAMSKESALVLQSNGSVIKQNSKEIIGHIRIPFLINDELSFDIGGSWSLGGITEPSDIIGEYSGTNGSLVLRKSASPKASHGFNAAKGEGNNEFIHTNRMIFGADAQFYISLLPMGGTIIKGEMYTGQTPFYGSAGLYTAADTVSLGSPVASTIYKSVMGFNAQLIQNLSNDLQVGVRYEIWDPNTKVDGTNFVIDNGDGTVTKLKGVSASSGFGGDLKVTTISAVVNYFIGGSLRFMLNWDHPVTEEFTKEVGTTTKTSAIVGDAHDDRVTIRMQYTF